MAPEIFLADQYDAKVCINLNILILQQFIVGRFVVNRSHLIRGAFW